MRIIACVKQVPQVSELQFDAASRTLVREGVPGVVNPFDRRALAEAIRLRELYGGEVVAVTMGPPQARRALIECLAAGADRAIHLLDPAFAGADTLATARALALAIRREAFDLIISGKYSVDAETGQVGPELAELLDLPQVTGATALTFNDDLTRMLVDRETDSGIETIDCELPALITASERLVRPIKVRPEQLEAASDRSILTLAAADLESDTGIFGLKGSPTWVTEIRVLSKPREVEIVKGESPEEKVASLIEGLKRRGALEGGSGRQRKSAPGEVRPSGSREVWAVAEILGDHLRPVSLELLGKGVELADKLNARLAALIAGADPGVHVPTLSAHGADHIYVARDRNLKAYSTEPFAALLSDAIREHGPAVVLLPATSQGRDLAPRVAARLGLGLTADCIDLDVDENERLIQYKPAFGGNVVALILSRTLPQMATVKPGMLQARAPNYTRMAEVTYLTVAKPIDTRTRLLGIRSEVSDEVADLDEADRIVCVGAGLGGPDNLAAVERLRLAMGARLGATRRVIDQGWLPRQHQIGLTGKVVMPRLYLGIGVRGVLNHTIGIRQSHTIVAINNDPAAEIFQTADLGIVAGWEEIVPPLTRQFEVMSSE